MGASFWLLANVLILVLVSVWCLWWPRVRYEHENPQLSGEDYWIPFCPHVGPRYSRGPDVFFFLHLADYFLRRRIREAFRRNELDDVVVRVRTGDVALYGYVEKSEEKLRAAQIAAAIPGVTSVRNEVAVQPRPEWMVN